MILNSCYYHALDFGYGYLFSETVFEMLTPVCFSALHTSAYHRRYSHSTHNYAMRNLGH